MGTNTKIFLNAHATPEKICYVILKSLGHEFIQKNNSLKKEIDIKLNSSAENPWRCAPTNKSFEINLSNPNYFELIFTDPCKQNYSVLLHLNVEDSDYCHNNEKLLNPKCNEIWLSIGKKLVDFFGGKMLYSDYSDPDNPNNWYENKKGSFPKKSKNQSGDDRWYQFQNSLHKTQPITKKEIESMHKLSAYPNDERIQTLSYFLDKLELVEKLTKELKEPKQKNTTKLKI